MANNTSEDIKLPKLDMSSKEWTTWKVWLQVVVASQGLSGYLDGTMTKPIDPATGQSPGWVATTPDKVKKVTEYVKNLAVWVEKDTKVQHIIANTLPNTLFIRKEKHSWILQHAQHPLQAAFHHGWGRTVMAVRQTQTEGRRRCMCTYRQVHHLVWGTGFNSTTSIQQRPF